MVVNLVQMLEVELRKDLTRINDVGARPINFDFLKKGFYPS